VLFGQNVEFLNVKSGSTVITTGLKRVEVRLDSIITETNMPCLFIHNECFVIKQPIAATDIPEHWATQTGDKRILRSFACGTVTHDLSLQAVENCTRVRKHGQCDRLLCLWVLKAEVLLRL
jgi:hypothetical protein